MSNVTTTPSPPKLFVGRIKALNRTKTKYYSIKNEQFYTNLDRNLNEIDLKNLTESQIEILRTVYKTFLNQNLEKIKNKADLVVKKRRKLQKKIQKVTLVSSENSSTSTNNSLDDFNDNLIKSKNLSLTETSYCAIKDLDRFSSVISGIKMTDSKKILNKKKTKISQDELDDLYSKNIDPIQKDMMPKWDTIDLEEKNGIIDLLERWQTSLTKNFNCSKKKQINDLNLNEARLIQSGTFDFDKNIFKFKKIQLELFDLCTIEGKIQPNTRLILRSFMQFLNTLNYLNEAKQNFITLYNNQYWKLINKSLSCLSRGIFRCLFYVHENAHLYKACIGLPPIFFLESDEIDNNDIPSIKLESLIEYAYLCLNRQNINLKLQEEHKYGNSINGSELTLNVNSSFKLRKYKLILNCLIRLIQMSCLIRDNITMKQIRFDKNEKVVDVDIYAHFIANNVNLIREYLLEILRN